jgi:hypothetical protein
MKNMWMTDFAAYLHILIVLHAIQAASASDIEMP